MSWYWYPIIVLGLYFGGFLTAFFVMKNNPKYFSFKTIVSKLSALGKAELAALKVEIEALLAKV